MKKFMAVVALAALTACNSVPVGTVVEGDGYRVTVVENAGEECAKVRAMFPGMPPPGLLGCAVWRAGFEGDAAFGNLFLPAELHCVAFAPGIRWVIEHEAEHCTEGAFHE